MRNWTGLSTSVLLGILLSWNGTALAQKPAGCPAPGTPEVLKGQVVKVDTQNGKLTVRSADGKVHKFQAATETLEAYKAGDPIEAKLRKDPNCP